MGRRAVKRYEKTLRDEVARGRRTCKHDALHASRMILDELCDIVHGVAVRDPDAVGAGLVLGNLLEGEVWKARKHDAWLKCYKKAQGGEQLSK